MEFRWFNIWKQCVSSYLMASFAVVQMSKQCQCHHRTDLFVRLGQCNRASSSPGSALESSSTSASVQHHWWDAGLPRLVPGSRPKKSQLWGKAETLIWTFPEMHLSVCCVRIAKFGRYFCRKRSLLFSLYSTLSRVCWRHCINIAPPWRPFSE